MNEKTLSVKEFFLSGRLERRSIDIVSAAASDVLWKSVDAELGNLDNRVIDVSLSLSRVLDYKFTVPFAWDFSRYFYQLGIYSKSEVIPDGYVIRKRRESDGEILEVSPPISGDIMEKLGQIFFNNYFLSYESIFLDKFLAEKIIKIYGVDYVESNDYYYELYPYMNNHFDYYKEKYGINLYSS